ncbi:glycosyltransferase [Candidatus Pacearchaeota archaeon]|nr:glycosyltransferase [Candidatus Pacearchaeota archaeon]
MELKPPVSIVIPSYNRIDALQNCLESIFAQDYSKDLYEIIVIDDGTDTPYKLPSFDVKLIRNSKRMGDPYSRNLGINNSKGEYILILDDDVTLVSSNFISKGIEILQNELIGMVAPKKIDLYLEEPIPPEERSTVAPRFVDGNLIPVKRSEGFIDYGCMVFIAKKSALLETGGYDITFGNFSGFSYRAESDLQARIRENGYKIYYAPHLTINHNIIFRGGRRRDPEDKTYWPTRNHVIFTKRHIPLWQLKTLGFLFYNVIPMNILNNPLLLPLALKGWVDGMMSSESHTLAPSDDKLIKASGMKPLKNPFISVVIPTYNRKDLVTHTIDSLISQNYPTDKYEVIVIDDGSKDETEKVVDGYRERVDNLQYFKQENNGPSAARNLGVKNSRGDIVAFIDDDCIASPDWLKNIISCFEMDSFAGIEGKVITTDEKTPFTHYVENLNGGSCLLANVAYRRDVLYGVGMFDEDFKIPGGEDFEIKYKILEKKLKIFFCQNALVIHPPFKESLFKFITETTNFSSTLNLYKKHPIEFRRHYGMSIYKVIFDNIFIIPLVEFKKWRKYLISNTSQIPKFTLKQILRSIIISLVTINELPKIIKKHINISN